MDHLRGKNRLPFDTRFGNGDSIGEDVVTLPQRGLRGPHLCPSPGRQATCWWSTTSAPHTAVSPTPGHGRCWSAWRTPSASPGLPGRREPTVRIYRPLRAPHPPRRRPPLGGTRRAALRRDIRQPGADGPWPAGSSEIVALVEAVYRWHSAGDSRSTRRRTSFASRTARPHGSSPCPPRSAAMSRWTG